MKSMIGPNCIIGPTGKKVTYVKKYVKKAKNISVEEQEDLAWEKFKKEHSQTNKTVENMKYNGPARFNAYGYFYDDKYLKISGYVPKLTSNRKNVFIQIGSLSKSKHYIEILPIKNCMVKCNDINRYMVFEDCKITIQSKSVALCKFKRFRIIDNLDKSKMNKKKFETLKEMSNFLISN